MRLPKQRSEKDRKENTPKTSTNIGCSNLMKRMLAVGLVVVAVSFRRTRHMGERSSETGP